MDTSITVLFLAANPVDAKSRLRLDEEFREIAEKLRAARERDHIKLACELAVRASDLQRALLDHQPHIVHFSGHGTKTTGIVLEDRDGRASPVNKQALARLFKVLRDNIRVVVMNACYAEDQAKSLTEFIDYTIGMSAAIGDSAAITFSAYFYQALAFGRSVREAFELARTQLELAGIAGSDIPRLLVRNGVDESVPLLDTARTGSTAVPIQTVVFPGSGKLARHLVGGNDGKRLEAAKELVQIPQEFFAELLIVRSRTDPNATVRHWINRALGKLGSRDAIETLRKNVNDADRFASLGAQDALKELGLEE